MPTVTTTTTAVGDGSRTEFVFTFEYLQKSFVTVSVDGSTPSFTFQTAYTIQITPAPAVGALVIIRRVTEKNELVTFVDGSVLLADDLNVAQMQALHVAVEAQEIAEGSFVIDANGAYSAGGRQLTALGTPTQPSDATTKNFVETSMTSQVVIATTKADEAAASAVQAATFNPALFLSKEDNLASLGSIPTARINLGLVIQNTTVDITAGRLLKVGAFGLGVIGTAPVLAAIDTTTTASGTYSYTTGATGTFPSGVTAAAGGVIVMHRESATKGYMTLQPTGSTVLYFRNLSTTWGAWQGLADLASPTFTGVPAVPTAAPATNTTQAASTAFVTAAAAAVAAAAGGMTLLGTLTTTSGTVQTLSSLNLTSYKELLFIFNGVSHGSINVSTYLIGTATVASLGSVSGSVSGRVYVSLATGDATPLLSNGTNPAPPTGYSTATTSVSISCSAGSFDAGSVLIYGVK